MGIKLWSLDHIRFVDYGVRCGHHGPRTDRTERSVVNNNNNNNNKILLTDNGLIPVVNSVQCYYSLFNKIYSYSVLDNQRT